MPRAGTNRPTRPRQRSPYHRRSREEENRGWSPKDEIKLLKHQNAQQEIKLGRKESHIKKLNEVIKRNIKQYNKIAANFLEVAIKYDLEKAGSPDGKEHAQQYARHIATSSFRASQAMILAELEESHPGKGETTAGNSGRS